VRQLPSERRFSKLAAAINHKAVSLGQSDKVTPGDLARVFLASEGKCAYCGIEVDWKGVSFDHVEAFAKGGRNVPANLAASCITCQRSKFTKTPDEHAEYQRLTVACEVCGKQYRPRWNDWKRGVGRTCSRKCSGAKGGAAVRSIAATDPG
jgi:5-methylcytosine-specific restriction endonuclease McrA